ncbi:hypothetical protein AB2J22_01915 [Aeromonas sp. A5]|uniref:hypothetical protein n=1 Tax=unclassified Aeromonas TaxID=257493 RepID=UPI00376FB770
MDNSTHNRNNRQNLYSNIASTIALVTSIMTVIFSWQQNNITKEHNRLSVKPILQLTPMVGGSDKRYGLYLSNVGFGPAIIKGFEVHTKNYSASGFESDQWDSVLGAANLKADCFATGWPKKNSTVKVDEETPLLSITNSDMRDRCIPEMIGLVGGDEVNVMITYESIYGDTYVEYASASIKSDTMKKAYQEYKKYAEQMKQLEKLVQ